MKLRASAFAVLLVLSTVGMAAAPAAGQQASGSAYSGAHVQFQMQGSAISDYAVGNNVIVENMTVQSAGQARSQAGIGVNVGLSAVTDFAGAGLQVASTTSTAATIQIASGAEMKAHDNGRGIFQIRAQDSSQIVRANLSGSAEAESAGQGRVVVTKDDGSQGTFIVVGDGEVVVNDGDNVTAEIEQGSQLVYRQYDNGRDDSDREAERMIQQGTATAEVYFQGAAESGEDGSDEGEEAAASVVEYGQDTTVEITSQGQSSINMTVQRTQSQGKVVLASISEGAFESTEDIQVFVDGEAAARADSYSAVEQSATQGDQPRYYVSQSSSAQAAANVAIGIDHFSSRNVRMASSGDGGMSFGTGAGFGSVVALAALGAAFVALRRRY